MKFPCANAFSASFTFDAVCTFFVFLFYFNYVIMSKRTPVQIAGGVELKVYCVSQIPVNQRINLNAT